MQNTCMISSTRHQTTNKEQKLCQSIMNKNDVLVVFTSSCLYEGSCLIYVICVCYRIVMSNTYCVVFLFCCLRLVYPMLSVSLDFPFLIAPSVFSNLYYLPLDPFG